VILWDVNVLVNAAVPRQEHHGVAAALVEQAISTPVSFALSELVLSSFVRVTTNIRIVPPVALDDALAFCGDLRDRPNAHIVAPGRRHWAIFEELCIAVAAKGPLISDVYHAALAIEHNCDWISFDRDFARFPGLRWRSPLD